VNARSKSLFIFPSIGLSTILLLVACVMAIVDGPQRTAWLGAAIAALPIPLLMTRFMIAPPVRTSENLPLYVLIASCGVLVACWEQLIEGTSGWGPTAVSLAGLLLLLLYIFWYSRFNRVESHELGVGRKLPEFTLTDLHGNVFDSKSLAGSPAVLLFYRGNWSPFCMAQIREIAGKYQDIEALGVKVVLISPQPETESRRLAEQYSLPITFLVDEDNALADSLGISVRHGVPAGMSGGYSSHTVLPTLLVTNASGTIIFSDQTDNYRVRPEPDVYLAILRRSGLVST
jgi:peroxiredoxin